MSFDLLFAAVIASQTPCANEAGSSKSVTTIATSPNQSSSAEEFYEDGARKWTPKVSFQYRAFLDDVTFSPDGKKFYFISTRGDEACDCTISELSVFQVQSVQAAMRLPMPLNVPKPLAVLSTRSVGQNFGMLSPLWENNNEIRFQGADKAGITQLYSFDVDTQHLSQITSWSTKVLELTWKRDTIIGTTEIPIPEEPPRYPVFALDRSKINRAILPYHNSRIATFVSYRGEKPIELRDTDVKIGLSPIYEPAGRKAIAVRVVRNPPTNWTKYAGYAATSTFGERPEFLQFVLIDAEHGTERGILDAPSGLSTSVGANVPGRVGLGTFWSADGSMAVLVNTALPLDAKHPERERMAYILSYDAKSGRWDILEPLEVATPNGLVRVSEVGWYQEGKSLLVRRALNGKPVDATLYALESGRWRGRPVNAGLELPIRSPMPTAGLAVAIEKGQNQPPHVVASGDGKRIDLTGEDPALKNLWWGRTSTFEWAESDGRTAQGGLLLPRGYSLARLREGKQPRLPLVVQAFEYNPAIFRPDGPYRHAFAGQTLIAKGFAVLSITIPAMERPPLRPSPEELNRFNDRVDSAVGALVAAGIADPSRVGLVGFSRGGFNTYYNITHPGKIRVSAAVIDDAFPGTYSYYLLQRAVTGQPTEYEQLYKGSFWENRRSWMQYETSFNVDRVSAPALFTIHNQSQIAFAAETVAAFSMNNKPLEYLVFPDAEHFLYAPRQRAASQQATVDWMSFWLNGITPADKERAQRWITIKNAGKAEGSQMN